MDSAEIIKLRNDVNDRDHVSGPPDAPVTLVQYGNFECIKCGRAFPVLREVRRILEGDLRFVFRHFPTVRTHPRSLRAAEASEAAAAQQRFWEMHDELFRHQQALEERHLATYAKRIGLDTERFARDMADNTFLKQIEADYERSLFDEHVTGIPTLYINRVRYPGEMDTTSLLAAIKQSDTEGRIQWPDTAKGVRKLLGRLRRRPRKG
jgi:formate-nitrite transporter family protein